MNVHGERILIFGDSLSHHGADSAPEVWEVNQGFARQSSAPGDLLASILAEQGAAAVRVDARVGRSAYNFFARESHQALLASDVAWRPTKVIVILGTNDADSGVSMEKDVQAMIALRDTFTAADAEVWAIGPFLSTINPQRVGAVIDMMHGVFGYRFIDGRPLSEFAERGRDGVHFTAVGARALAMAMANALATKPSPKSIWLSVAVGAAAIAGGVVAYKLWNRHQATLGDSGESSVLTEVATQVRQDLTACGYGGGRCADASREIANRLRERGVDARVVHGSFVVPIGSGHAAKHSWVEVGDQIIDATVDQFQIGFDETLPEVLVTTRARAPWYRSNGALAAPDEDEDDQQKGEDTDTWWERLTKNADRKHAKMREALEANDAVILDSYGRKILLLKTPEMSNTDEGSIRVTAFDEDGPIGHTTRATLEELATEMSRDWNPKAIAPASEAEVVEWTSTERFAEGARRVAEVQRANAGLKGPKQTYFVTQIDDAGSRRIGEGYSSPQAAARSVADEIDDVDTFASTWNAHTDGARYEIGAEDSQDTKTVSINKLFGWSPKVNETITDVAEGRTSFSSDQPIVVSRLDSPRGAFWIVDGHHRAVEAAQRGDTKVSVVIDDEIPRIERTGGAYASVLAERVNITRRVKGLEGPVDDEDASTVEGRATFWAEMLKKKRTSASELQEEVSEGKKILAKLLKKKTPAKDAPNYAYQKHCRSIEHEWVELRGREEALVKAAGKKLALTERPAACPPPFVFKFKDAPAKLGVDDDFEWGVGPKPEGYDERKKARDDHDAGEKAEWAEYKSRGFWGPSDQNYRVAYALVTRRDGEITTVRAIVDAPRALTLAEAEKWRRQHGKTTTAWVETMAGEFVPVKGAMKFPKHVKSDQRAGEVDSTLTKPSNYAMAQLPRDMREELFNLHATGVNPDATERTWKSVHVPRRELDISKIDVSSYPPASTEGYDPLKLPPIVIANGKLIDGGHRVAAAQRQGIKTLDAIDMTGLIDPDKTGFVADL